MVKWTIRSALISVDHGNSGNHCVFIVKWPHNINLIKTNSKWRSARGWSDFNENPLRGKGGTGYREIDWGDREVLMECDTWNGWRKARSGMLDVIFIFIIHYIAVGGSHPCTMTFKVLNDFPQKLWGSIVICDSWTNTWSVALVMCMVVPSYTSGESVSTRLEQEDK